MSTPPPGHLGPVLSALLDGELDEVGRAAAGAHLAACADCRRELDGVAAARTAVRELPAVEPPRGFFEGLLSGRRRRRWVAAWAASAAAAVAVGSLASAPPPRVRPPVTELVEAHAAAASVVGGDPISQLVPAGVPVSFRR